MSTEVKGIRKEVSKGKVTVTRVYAGDYQKEGTLTAELKQEIKIDSYYPSKSISNNLQDNPFNMKDFGFEEKAYSNTETRVAWIDVPVGTTLEQVQAKLDALNGVTLYRILSNHPILTDQQAYAIENETTGLTKAYLSNKQAVRFGKNSDREGELALDVNGKVQYRQVFFSTQEKEDINLRTEDPSDFYASDEILSEINNTPHIVEGQQL